jgi:hypothetical protein
MNKEQKALKQKILEAIKHTREELEYTLVSDEWGSSTYKFACALGCVLAKYNPNNLDLGGNENFRMVQELLGVDEKWVDSFIEGFDGNGTSDQAKVPGAWEMGFAIAKETKPIAFHLWDGNPPA